VAERHDPTEGVAEHAELGELESLGEAVDVLGEDLDRST
jgi:hypothetical protein